MAIKTYAEQLESVQTAIAQIEAHGQAYEITDGGAQRKLDRANLYNLYAREQWLRKMADRESNGGAIGITYGVVGT